MKPEQVHAKRVVLTAICCGYRYRRWRFRMRRTFPDGHTHCAHCRKPLFFHSAKQ